MGKTLRRIGALTSAVLCLLGSSPGQAEAPLRTGTIVIGIPRAEFVVLAADRLWTNALAKPGDSPRERQGQQMKIARHASLPLAIAAAGLGTLGPQQDTMAYVRELIAPLDRSSLDFDTIVERVRPSLHQRLRAVRGAARQALAVNPANAEAQTRLRAARLTLLVAYASAGRATLGWIELGDDWTARRASPPRGAVAWPSALDPFYTTGPFAGAAQLFAYSIQEPGTLVEHARRVIQAGINEDARRNPDGDRHVGGPVDVVLIDARGARCMPSCSSP